MQEKTAAIPAYCSPRGRDIKQEARRARRLELERQKRELDEQARALERQKAEAAEAERRRREQQEREEQERRRREAEERLRREALKPVEVAAAQSQTVLVQVQNRIAELAKANPSKRLRITIEVVDP